MDIETSKRYVILKYPWGIDESTFQVIDEQYCLWAAQVTTTFRRRELKLPERTFPILVSEKEVFAELSNNNLRVLGEWCLRQDNKA